MLEIFRGSETPCVKELRPKLEALVDLLMYYSEAMLRVIPGLTSGIQAEEVKDRLRIIGMLGRIYSIEADEKDIPLPAAHPALCYAEAHIQQHFGTAFLNRFNDVHPKAAFPVRSPVQLLWQAATACVACILQRYPQITTAGVGVCRGRGARESRGQRKIARKAVSSS